MALRKLSDVVRERNEGLALLYDDREAGKDVELQYIPTGLSSLDKLGLLEKGILTIVGGDPGVGKTAWAIQFLKSAADAGYNPFGFFFEDPIPFISDRITSQAIGESAYKLRRIELAGNDISDRVRSVADRLDWLQYVTIEDTLTSSTDVLTVLDERTDESTGLVVIDYAQAFDAEQDEKSVERVIARLAWGLNQLAKKKSIAIVLFSQLKTEVRERGNKWYENYRWKTGQDADETSAEAVEGFRPRSGDLQWSSALYQRAKQILYLFRPGHWLRTFGVNAKDDKVQVQIDKGNYGPNKEIVEFEWNGALAMISEKQRKKK